MVTVDDDVKIMVDEVITSGVRGIVPLTTNDNAALAVGMVVEIPIYDDITSRKEVTAEDGVTSGICSVVETLGANIERKGFHLVTKCQTISCSCKQKCLQTMSFLHTLPLTIRLL